MTYMAALSCCKQLIHVLWYLVFIRRAQPFQHLMFAWHGAIHIEIRLETHPDLLQLVIILFHVNTPLLFYLILSQIFFSYTLYCITVLILYMQHYATDSLK